MEFKEMGLSQQVLQGVKSIGFESATPIQEKVIPLLLEKKCDLIGLAQTGTGKTAAFGLPSLENIELGAVFPQLLILSPTRELCMQISKDIDNFSKYINGLKSIAVYGGAPIDRQIGKLKRGVHVIVATPGRIHDLVRRNCVNLSKISTLVLDEADEMLKMGFRDDLDAILAKTPEEKNTLLFSATMAPGILAITKKYMNDPIEITIGKKNASTENVSHIYHIVNSRDRYNALKRVVDFHPDIYGIVFCRTRQETKDIASSLMNDGYNSEALHGDLSQSQRDYVMKKFREKNLNILVATDVAARGLDVSDLTHIINYNMPDDNEIYTHRTGRTGRAGKKGIAVSIVQGNETGKIAQIERLIQKKFQKQPVPTGDEICKRRIISTIENMQRSTEPYKEIDAYMDKVYDVLGDLPKEEIIKRFVSQEFNRFVEYYKDAPDLNITHKDINGVKSNGFRKKLNNGNSMSKVLFNVGKGKNITKREIIDLFIKAPGARNVEIGQIDIFSKTSSVEVESKFVNKIIGKLNQSNYKGIRIEARRN